MIPWLHNLIHKLTAPAPLRIAIERQGTVWTAADATIWREFRKCETWAKIERMSHDSMVMDIVPPYGVTHAHIEDPAKVREYVTGRRNQMAYLQALAGEEPRDVPIHAHTDTDMPAVFEEEEPPNNPIGA